VGWVANIGGGRGTADLPREGVELSIQDLKLGCQLPFQAEKRLLHAFAQGAVVDVAKEDEATSVPASLKPLDLLRLMDSASATSLALTLPPPDAWPHAPFISESIGLIGGTTFIGLWQKARRAQGDVASEGHEAQGARRARDTQGDMP